MEGCGTDATCQIYRVLYCHFRVVVGLFVVFVCERRQGVLLGRAWPKIVGELQRRVHEIQKQQCAFRIEHTHCTRTTFKEEQRAITMSLVDTAAAGSWDTLKLSPFVCVVFRWNTVPQQRPRQADDTTPAATAHRRCNCSPSPQ